MQTEAMIPANDFCIHHQVELSFIYALHESGLIETSKIEEEIFVPLSQLKQLETMVKMHYEMDINLEGIETINYLLKQINHMQQQMIQLNNKLNYYSMD
ncbi:MAG: chaperone modulator CbpM [Chitinophagaceae bacterium]|nr:chaperone modulator CbpM [Chitinophagaceae bacterium]